MSNDELKTGAGGQSPLTAGLGSVVFIGVDYGSPDGDYTSMAFYDPEKDEFYFEEVPPNEK
ncbi:MAG: hypothetical protein ABIU85_09570 [Methylotenera sp.]